MREMNQASRFDFQLAFILLLLFFISCIAIYSAQTTEQYGENFLLKQIIWYGIGAGIVAIIIWIDSDQLKKLSWIMYGIGLFLLTFLLVAPTSIAPVINGAKSWYKIPALGSFQPSEFVKVFLIVALARVIVDHHEKYFHKTVQNDLFLLCKMVLVTGAPIVLIIMQPDLGTSLVLLAILSGMIVASGISWKMIASLFVAVGSFASIIFYLVIEKPEILEQYLGVKPYQFGRIYSWIDPYNYSSTIGYQLTRSLLAIGSGETFGKGFGTREVYLPESHTDFIFSIIGEEFGFIGASVLISIFFLLIYHLTRVGIETKIPFNTYICVGVISMITFHVFQNIGMTIGLLPITGIPLPFISYGGSSLMGNMLAIGLIFSIRFHYKKYMFSNDEE